MYLCVLFCVCLCDACRLSQVSGNGAPQFSEGPVNADFSGVLQVKLRPPSPTQDCTRFHLTPSVYLLT